MKIYSIKNEYLKTNNIIGYLFYYSSDCSYSIELKENIDPYDMTIYFAAFTERQIYTLGPDWSKRWVEMRIVPRDRQNLGAILREAGLAEYDSHRLIVLSEGRCAQDDLSISPISEDNLETWAKVRLERRIGLATPISNGRILITLNDKTVRIADLKSLIGETATKRSGLNDLLNDEAKLRNFKTITGGTGIAWDEDLYIMADELTRYSTKCCIDSDDLRTIITGAVIDTAGLINEYGVSRQYINRITNDGILPAIASHGRSMLYLKSDAERVLRR